MVAIKKRERGAKRGNRALSVFWLERNPGGNEKRGGVRGSGKERRS